MGSNNPLPGRPTWAEIDLDALAFNFESSRSFIGSDVKYMAVVKADAYGHGAVRCAERLERAGVDWFAVALVEEGVELRNAGISKPILILGGFWNGQEDVLLDLSLTPVIFSIEQARRLAAKAAARGVIASIHLKIDTGMGRVGIRPDDLTAFADQLKTLGCLQLEGVMTHFASADDISTLEFTYSQIRKFEGAVEVLRSRGFTPEILDMANSPGAVGIPESRAKMVRLGGILYGLGGDVLPDGIEKPELRPVMSLRSRIAQLKMLKPGDSVGYGRTFVAERESLIATVPVGYHDGYRRAFSNRATAIVNGRPAKVIGTVSMDWTVLDVTEIPQVAEENLVVMIGTEGPESVLAEDLARIAGTISYEITCGIGLRVPRIFKAVE